jgi:hypothetical protein
MIRDLVAISQYPSERLADYFIETRAPHDSVLRLLLKWTRSGTLQGAARDEAIRDLTSVGGWDPSLAEHLISNGATFAALRLLGAALTRTQ